MVIELGMAAIIDYAIVLSGIYAIVKKLVA